ncbi:MAG TPA: hypothetical protein VET85_04190 [Stellaceae bacterium]|nr:hypothetical protein [Stellaceae bacterium]
MSAVTLSAAGVKVTERTATSFGLRLLVATALALPVASLSKTSFAQPVATCPTSRPEIAIDLAIPEPEIDNELTQPALQALAGNAHHQGRTQGLYRVKLSAHAETAIEKAMRGDRACFRITKVSVQITMIERKIYITRKRRPGTCAFDAVLAHERKHQFLDDEILRARLPAVRGEIENAVVRLPPFAAAAAGQEGMMRARLGAAIHGALSHALKTLEAERKLRQQEVDTPREYRRVAAACG